MLPYYRTAASTMYTLKCMVYITAPKTELQFSFLLGPIPLPFFLEICDWLIQERLSCTSLNMFLSCIIKTCSTLEILKLVESSGNSGRWHPLLVSSLCTILKSVHSPLQNECFPFDLFIVRKQKNAAYDRCLTQLLFFSILQSQNYFLYSKSYLHSSSTIVKLYLSYLHLQSCNGNIYFVYVPRKFMKRIKTWMPHTLAQCLNKKYLHTAVVKTHL